MNIATEDCCYDPSVFVFIAAFWAVFLAIGGCVYVCRRLKRRAR